MRAVAALSSVEIRLKARDCFSMLWNLQMLEIWVRGRAVVLGAVEQKTCATSAQTVGPFVALLCVPMCAPVFVYFILFFDLY